MVAIEWPRHMFTPRRHPLIGRRHDPDRVRFAKASFQQKHNLIELGRGHDGQVNGVTSRSATGHGTQDETEGALSRDEAQRRWAEEITRRANRALRGESVGRDANEVLTSIESKLRR